MNKPIYVIDGLRTPFLKAKGRGPFSASDLAVWAGRELLARQPFAPTDIDETVIGCMMPSENEANIGRLIGLRLGCGNDTPGWTVQRNCASGMQSIDCALKDIQLGRADLVLAGGTEVMSRAPLNFRPEMVEWLTQWQKAKTAQQKISAIIQFKLKYLAPIITLLHGLSDPLYGLSMGQTAEILADRFNITREEMDQFAFESHEKAEEAKKLGYLNEITPVYSGKGECFTTDTGVRADTTLEQLGKLKPMFDKYGLVTAGNSSQVTDGAALLILASEEAVKKFNLKPLGKIVDVEWAGLSPDVMGLGPVMAATPILKRNNLSLDDINYWEINEAFAAQVLACLKAWESDEFCKKQLGLDKAMGKLNRDTLNIDGGAIALGHPVGASGARIVLHLLEILKRTNSKRGMASICIGGGQGGAMLLELV